MAPSKAHLMTLAFVGNANHDLYLCLDNPSYLRAIPKVNSGASETGFGDKYHIKRLMHNGYFDDVPTDDGLTYLTGLHSVIHYREDGSLQTYLSF